MAKKKFINKAKDKLSRVLGDLAERKYDLSESFDFTESSQKVLDDYFKEMEVLKKEVSNSEYENIIMSIKEHFYVVLRDYQKKNKGKKIGVDVVREVISDLGDPEEFMSLEDGDIVDETKRESIGKKMLMFLWVLTKYSFYFLLFVSLYIPLIISFLSVSLSGIAVMLVWLVGPNLDFGDVSIVTSTVGGSMPAMGMGLIALGIGLTFLTINIVGRIHWKKPIINAKMAVIAPIVLGILLMFGSVVYFFQSNSVRVSDEEKYSESLEGIEGLVVGDFIGQLKIIGDDSVGDNIEITEKSYASGSSKDKARENLKSINFDLEEKSGKYILTSSYDSSLRNMYHFESITVEVRVPKGIEIEFRKDEEMKVYLVGFGIDNVRKFTLQNLTSDLNLDFKSGALEIIDVENNEIAVKNSFGSVDLAGVYTNSVNIESNSGSVDIEESTVGGNLEVVSNHGTIDIVDVEAETVTVKGTSGSVDVVNINGDLSVNTAHGSIDVENLEGNLEIDAKNGSVDVVSVNGNAEVTTKYGNIDIEDVKGDLVMRSIGGSIDVMDLFGSADITCEYGNVDIRFEDVPAGSKNKIVNQHGSIDISIPADVDPVIFTKSSWGSIDNDFQSNRGDEDSPEFEVETKYGSIDIRRN